LTLRRSHFYRNRVVPFYQALSSERTHLGWLRHFYAFVQKRAPAELAASVETIPAQMQQSMYSKNFWVKFSYCFGLSALSNCVSNAHDVRTQLNRFFLKYVFEEEPLKILSG